MNKPFRTIEEQIQILKDRNLTIKSYETAQRELNRFGYYEIINGYKDPFLESINPDKFKDGTTFDDIYSLYRFDYNLRNATVTSLLEIETNLRSVVAYTIAEKFGHLEADYLVRTNYRSGKKYNDGYKIDKLLKKFRKIIADDIQPFRHYRKTHGNCPPWILLKGTTFGNLINFIKLQKAPIKNLIIARCYGMDPSIVTDEIKDLFMDSLSLFLSYRNRAAHSGRIYNYIPESKIRYFTPFHTSVGITSEQYRLGYGINDWTTLMATMGLFENDSPAEELNEFINILLNNYSRTYPENHDYLIKAMRIIKEHIEYN